MVDFMRYKNQSFERLGHLMLTLSLAFLSIPGIKNLDLSFFGLRLGRLQPFKIFFVFWMVLRGVQIYKNHKTQPIQLKIEVKWFLVGCVVLDFLLFLGLLGQSGLAQGWSIWVALILGQIAFVLTVLGKKLPSHSVIHGLFWASLILTFFAVIEQVFPHSEWAKKCFDLIRDDTREGFQTGSSLAVSGLAEFCVRALPLVLLFIKNSKKAVVTSALLILLGLVSLERSAILSFLMIFVFTIPTPIGRRYWKPFLAIVMMAFVGVVVAKGPEKILGRYLGGLSIAPKNSYSAVASSTIQQRKELWLVGLRAVEYSPWKGIGLGGYSFRKINALPPFENLANRDPRHSHNVFLEIAISGGLIALLALLFLLGGYAWKSWRCNPKQWIGILYLVGQIPSMMTDSRIYVSWLAITFFWFAGIAWSLRDQLSDDL